MSRRPPFEPISYAKHLEASGNFASDNNLLYEWSGTHWNALDEKMGEDWQ
jgi:putative DNA primase/helicase